MMAATRRRERELVAVAFNQKEQRVLEKSIATIKLESSYSLKLLDLNNRSIKVRFRQMKDRVSRIKSYLAPEEIQKLRELEAEGKLRPMYTPVSLGSALKIAAAARRLNSSHGPRAKSALPRVNLPDKGKPTPQAPPPPSVLKRSNSVSGAFIDAPPPRLEGRPGSALETVGRSIPSPTLPEDVDGPPRGSSKNVNGGGSTAAVPANRKAGSGPPPLQITGDGIGRPGSSASGMSRAPSPSAFLQVHNPNQHPEHRSVGFSATLSSSSFHSSADSHNKRSGVSSHPQQSVSTTTESHHHPQFKRPASNVSISSGHASTAAASQAPLGQANGHATDIMGAKSSGRNSVSTSSHSRTNTSHAHAPFSSHVATEKEGRERQAESGGPGGEGTTKSTGPLQTAVTVTPRSPHGHGSIDRNSAFMGLNDDTVDDLGEDLYAERRAELLEEEQYRASVITRRKDRFLKDIDRYLKENPPLRSVPASTKISPKENAEPDSSATGAGGGGNDRGVGALGGILFRRRRVEFDNHPTYLPETDYRERLMGLWRDMNKCRYLRVPDEMLDMSGINTLATDTMRLYQVIRQGEVDSIPGAWME